MTQIHVRSRRGRNSKGKKISGIRVMPDQEHILITSNDSRIRLFRLSDFSLVCKYKGMVNDSFQLVASPSETGDHIICGSEANVVSVWNTSKRQDGLAFSLARQKWSERKVRAWSPVSPLPPLTLLFSTRTATARWNSGSARMLL